jgi:hypothetical protein
VTPWVLPDLHGFTRFVAGEEDEHEEHDEHDEHDTQIKGKHTHTQDTHRLSSLARFTNSIESQGRDSKSRIPCCSIWMFVLGGLAFYWIECPMSRILILRSNTNIYVCMFRYLELGFNIEVECLMLFG